MRWQPRNKTENVRQLDSRWRSAIAAWVVVAPFHVKPSRAGRAPATSRRLLHPPVDQREGIRPVGRIVEPEGGVSRETPCQGHAPPEGKRRRNGQPRLVVPPPWRNPALANEPGTRALRSPCLDRRAVQRRGGPRATRSAVNPEACPERVAQNAPRSARRAESSPLVRRRPRRTRCLAPTRVPSRRARRGPPTYGPSARAPLSSPRGRSPVRHPHPQRTPQIPQRRPRRRFSVRPDG